MKLNKILIRDFKKMDKDEQESASLEILKLIILYIAFIVIGTWLTY